MKKTAVALATAMAIAAVGFTGAKKADAAAWVAPVIAGAAVGTTVATGHPFGLGYEPYAYSNAYEYGAGYGAYAYSPSQPTDPVPHGLAPQLDYENDAYGAESN